MVNKNKKQQTKKEKKIVVWKSLKNIRRIGIWKLDAIKSLKL